METLSNTKVDNEFNPYSWNGGSIVAVAGDDYVILASDNRMSEGYIVHSRNTTKIKKLSKNLFVGICGFHGDVLSFLKSIELKIKDYQIHHKKIISSASAAQLISVNLYYRRFFPFYIYVILCGIDEQGHGVIYSYDPVGSYEKVACRASGSASDIIQPILDNQISLKNQKNPQSFTDKPQHVAQFIHDVFTSAAERDIYTGDGGTALFFSSTEERVESFSLRSD